jgi:hypothetical protein
MKTISMADFAAEIEARKRELGLVDDEAITEALRNKGSTRTPKKRAFLARIDKRAISAGKKPIRSYY